MTYQEDFTLPTELLSLIAANGFDAVPELIRIVINAAMQTERQHKQLRGKMREIEEEQYRLKRREIELTASLDDLAGRL